MITIFISCHNFEFLITSSTRFETVTNRKCNSNKNTCYVIIYEKMTKISLNQIFVPKLTLKVKSHKNRT